MTRYIDNLWLHKIHNELHQINYHIRLKTLSIYDANIPMGSYFMTKIYINHQVQLQRYLKGTNTKIQEK